MEQLTFSGKITASITHELQNVLAIIQESCGLMEDFILLSEDSSDSLKEKLASSLGTIYRQL